MSYRKLVEGTFLQINAIGGINSYKIGAINTDIYFLGGKRTGDLRAVNPVPTFL